MVSSLPTTMGHFSSPAARALGLVLVVALLALLFLAEVLWSLPGLEWAGFVRLFAWCLQGKGALAGLGDVACLGGIFSWPPLSAVPAAPQEVKDRRGFKKMSIGVFDNGQEIRFRPV